MTPKEQLTSKCKVKGSHVEPCRWLESACDGDAPSGKARGIYRWAFVNVNTHNPTRTMFGAKTSDSPKGAIFNFCPWCGANLQKSQP